MEDMFALRKWMHPQQNYTLCLFIVDGGYEVRWVSHETKWLSETVRCTDIVEACSRFDGIKDGIERAFSSSTTAVGVRLLKENDHEKQSEVP